MWVFNLKSVCLIIAAVSSGVTGKQLETIVGGGIAQPEEFPYQVSLQSNNGKHFCGGSIISAIHILTAAHCVYYFDEPNKYNNFYVLSGTNNLKIGGNVHEIKSVKIHPGYIHPPNLNEFKNDIAILTLKKPIYFNIRENYINLPTRDNYYGYEAVVSGWGSTVHYGDMNGSQVLKKLKTKILYEEECLRPHTQICTYSFIANGICSGDSGGPLVVNNELVGIASYIVKNCANGYEDGFTKVFSYLNFIRREIENSRHSIPNYPKNNFSIHPHKVPFFKILFPFYKHKIY